MRNLALACLVAAGLITMGLTAAAQPRGPGARTAGPVGPDVQEPTQPYAGPPWIDVHVHFRGGARSYDGAAESVIAAMDRVGTRVALLMPPPFPASGERESGTYDADRSLAVAPAARARRSAGARQCRAHLRRPGELIKSRAATSRIPRCGR